MVTIRNMGRIGLMGTEIVRSTSAIVSAFIRNNTVARDALPSLIQAVHLALSTLDHGPAAPMPAVPVKKSVFHDHLICLEDGKRVKMLKRYLKRIYGLTPDEYRAKWSLPRSYPMVCPDYAAKRSALARHFGLGLSAASEASEAQEIPEVKRRREVA